LFNASAAKGIKDSDLAPLAELNHLNLLHMPVGSSDAAFQLILPPDGT